MSNRYLCHPDGHDDNGGGYDLLGSADYSDCHSSFGPVASRTGCSIINNGSGKVRIEDEGAFSSDMSGVIVNCTFSDGDATYTCGRYIIIDASSTYIDLDLTFTSATPTVDVRVGGAIKSPDAAADLAYGTDGDELVFPANQTTQTVNEVDGSANQIALTGNGNTLDAYGVDEDTGVRLTTTDSTKWPVIKAKDSSTWSASTAMFLANGGSSSVYPTIKLDKLLFDGNDLTPRVMQIGDNASYYVYMRSGDIEICNSHQTVGYGLYQQGYINHSYDSYSINTIYIHSCWRGYYSSTRRVMFVNKLVHIDDCTIGIHGSILTPEYISNLNYCIISNCTTGLSFLSKQDGYITARFTFTNNDVDLNVTWNYGILNELTFTNSVFEHSAGGGDVTDLTSNSGAVVLTLINCVYSDEATLEAGDSITCVGCETIHGYPFVDSDDYRLDPDFADLDKIWDWDNTTNCIGATTPAEPESSSGGGFPVLESFIVR